MRMQAVKFFNHSMNFVTYLVLVEDEVRGMEGFVDDVACEIEEDVGFELAYESVELCSLESVTTEGAVDAEASFNNCELTYYFEF